MQSNPYINTAFKAFNITLLAAGLLACQTLPETAVTPESDVETASLPATPQPDPAQMLYEQANKSLKQGEIDLAIQQFEQVVQQNPAAKQAYTNLGLLYIHKQDNPSAKKAFLNAIEQDKNDAIAYNHLAVIERQEGQFKQALFNYYKAINANPDYANAHLNLGILLDIYLQELPKALEQYEKYQQLTGNSNEEVEKWIIDIKRRIDDEGNKAK